MLRLMITLAPVTPVHSDLRPGSWPALLSTNVNSLEHRSQTLISSKVNYQSWAIINTASDLHHLHQHHGIVHQITYFIPVPATLDPDPFNILNTVLHLWWDTQLYCVWSVCRFGWYQMIVWHVDHAGIISLRNLNCVIKTASNRDNTHNTPQRWVLSVPG